MKKNLFWMLAAILFCGITVTMLTSCGDDEPIVPTQEPSGNDDEGDDPEGEGEEEEIIVKAGVYDISVAYILHRPVLEFFDIELVTTDQNGNQNTYNFTNPHDQSDGFQGNEEKQYSDLAFGTFRMIDDLFTMEYCKNVLVRRIIFRNVPVDKSVQFVTTFHKKQDLEITPQKYGFIRPCFVFTQTPKDDNKATVLNDCSVRASLISSNFERWINQMDGKPESNGTFVLTAGSKNIGAVN